MMNDDHFADFDEEVTSAPREESAPIQDNGGGGRRFAEEIFSKRIFGQHRTFFVDVKQSTNGTFLKISEKSRGRKSTIMMDAEDVEAFVEALQEAKTHL